MREKTTRRWLSLLLTVVMVLSLVPATALAAYFGAPVQRDLGLERADAIGEIKETLAGAAETTANSGDFMRIVHLDCGRKYFTVDWVKSLIDEMAKDGYSHLELAFGNDGLRFLLDDMSVTVDGTTYSGDSVKAGIQAGNKAYYDAGTNEWSEAEMDAIIKYATDKGIGIIPLLNTPGHMDAIINAMKYVGISNPAFAASGYGTSSRTVNLENETAVAFTQALVQKYIKYFDDKGCEYFHLGTDEYANDILINYNGMGFGYLQDQGKYKLFVDYVNTLAEAVTAAGMTPMAFNDGIYYGSNTTYAFDNSLLITYWSNGWGNYSPASAQFLANKGLQLINTHGEFYYVLGKADNFDNYGSSYAANWDNKKFPGTNFDEEKAGAMFCIWCDYPGAETEAEITNKVINTGILSTLAEKMGATAVDPEPEKTITGAPATLTVGKTAILSVDEPAEWTSDNENVISLSEATSTQAVSGSTNSVTATAVGAGSATITATTDSATYTADIKVVNAGEPTEYRTINVTVGQTATDTIEGNWSADVDKTELNEAIATVSAVTQQSTGKEVQEVTFITSGKQYLIVNTRANQLLTNETTVNNTDYLSLSGDLRADSEELWTITGSNGSYTVQDASNKYLTIGNGSASMADRSATLALNYTNSGTSGTWTISRTTNGNTYYLNDYEGKGSQAAGWNGYGASTDAGSQWRIYEVVDTPAGEVTTVTFNGVTEGTTYVTVGNVRYTINVIKEDLSKVTPLTVEYWITNRKVTANGATSGTIAADANGVYSENGALFSSLVPATGTQDSNTMVFWKGTCLAYGNHQTDTSGVDRTQSGTDFTYIRYWDGSWAYSADGETWTNVADDDQIVAYYLQKTDVTDEVTTEVVDWGVIPSTSYNSENFVLVDFAVKYESGDRTPDSFPVSGKTMAFHCDPGDRTTVHQYENGGSSYWYNNYRDLGMIKAEESEQYEVYLITVTMTNDTRTTQVAGNANTATSYEYNGTEYVAWAATQEDLDNSGLGTYSSISNKYSHSIGGEAITPGLEIFNRHGALVTYYVRAKVTEDSLTVHYIDQTASKEFYNYIINVTSGTTFDANIGLNNPWKGDLANGTVKNNLNKDQTVSADLSTMPAIGAQYRYSDYTCVKVERRNDGKDVYLYYTFNNAKSFVIDFGLPLTITTTDLGITDTGNLSSSTITQGTYGTAEIKDGAVTYTPTKVLEGAESLQLTLTATDGGKATHQIYIYPASNVLYEDNFLTQVPEESSRNNWTTFTESGISDSQANGLVDNDQYVYGYDPAYASSVGVSGHSATVTVQSGVGSKALSTGFNGNGFDVIGNCDTDTATVYVVIKDTAGKAVKGAIVDTRYLGELHQVPLAHLTFDEGSYTAEIRAFYSKAVSSSSSSAASLFSTRSMYSQTDASSLDDVMAAVMADGLDLEDVELVYFDSASPLASLGGVSAVSTFALDTNAADTSATPATRDAGIHAAIDGFRVYRSSDNTAYKTDEQNVTYVNVLDAVEDGFAAYVEGDTSGTWTKEDYESNGGPQNEIYLNAKQADTSKAVTFKLTGVRKDDTVQISARAVSGAANLNGDEPITSNTEMYYEVTAGADGVIAITNTGDGMLAIGNLKLPAGAAIAEMTEADYTIAYAMLRTYAAAAPVEPEEPEVSVFQPAKLDLNVTSANFFTRKIVTLSITASSDVAYLTVNGKRVEPTNALLVKWGLAKNYLYVVTDTVSRNATAEFAVVAYDANGVASEVYVKQG